MKQDSRPPPRSLPQVGCEGAGGSPSPGPGAARDAALIAQGWERRHMVGPDRAEESRELYESLGFEVVLRPVTPQDFGTVCQQCAAACDGWVIIYTRRGAG